MSKKALMPVAHLTRIQREDRTFTVDCLCGWTEVVRERLIRDSQKKAEAAASAHWWSYPV